MESSFIYKQEQSLNFGDSSGLQPQPPISRKRTFLECKISPCYELDIPTTGRPNKRSRESSYDDSVSPILVTTPSVSTPTSYSSSPLSNCEIQQYTDVNKKLSTSRFDQPVLFRQESSHDSSPTEAPPIKTPFTTIVPSGPGNLDDRIAMHIDFDGDTCMDDGSPERPDEICFGMIQESRVTSSQRRIGVSTVLVLRYHKALMTTTVHLESGQYWGLLDSHTTIGIALLMNLQSIRLYSFIPSRKQANKGPQQLQDSPDDIPIYIIVYGSERIFEDVGKLLCEKQIFLQHPLFTQKNTEYRNPQLLTIPIEMKLTVRTPMEMVDEVTAIFETVEHTELPQMDTASIITTPLFRHQKQALSFMMEKESQQAPGSRDSIAGTRQPPNLLNIGHLDPFANTGPTSLNILPEAYGGILADQMGLGKSLTTLALIASSINQAEAFGRTEHETHRLLHAKTTLLIAPNSLLSSWQEQIDMHVETGKLKVYRYHGPKRELNPRRLATYDIIMTTYSTISHEFFPKGRAKARESPMKEIMWFRVVLDEAHIIRERSTQQSRAVCSLETKNRWCLTGTPIQNKLDDLGSLFKFLRVGPCGSTSLFNNLIVNPLKKADPQGLQRLQNLIARTSIRRTKKILELPPRTDQTEYIQFSNAEKQVYEACMKDSKALIEAALSGKTTGNSYFSILQSFLRLRLICDHGKELLPKDVNCRIEEYIKFQEHSNSENICTETQNLFGDANLAICEFCGCSIAKGNSRAEISALCFHVVCSKCLLQDQTLAQDGNEGVPLLLCPLCEETEDTQNSGEQLKPKVNWISESTYSGPSTKVKALLAKLRDCEAESSSEPIKSVVFSCWTKMLDLIAYALCRERMGYRRIDGSMTLQQREDSISCFRQNPLVSVLLISIGTGSVGLNLTVASRVHLMEPQWNPMVEQQALGRVHRIGQTKEVITTRYIMKDSFEESIVTFQQRKLALVDLSLTKGPATKTEALRERLKELRGLFK